MGHSRHGLGQERDAEEIGARGVPEHVGPKDARSAISNILMEA